jgi:AcrR family transcriptional regulator
MSDGPGNAGTSLRDRILDATVAAIAARGVAKTTIDDIARGASCGRATVYRTFAGGRDAILAAAGRREVDRFLDGLAAELAGCLSLEDAVVTAVTRASRQLVDHDALRYLVVNEPTVLLPLVSFDGLDPLLERAAAFAELHLARFTDAATARAVGEWAGRLTAAYACGPDVSDVLFDLGDEDATRHLVRTYGLPGLMYLTQE